MLCFGFRNLLKLPDFKIKIRGRFEKLVLNALYMICTKEVVKCEFFLHYVIISLNISTIDIYIMLAFVVVACCSC